MVNGSPQEGAVELTRVADKVDRLRQTGGDLPHAHLDALARAVDAYPEPARRTGRPPKVPARVG